MNFIQPIIGLHGLYFLFLGFRYLLAFLSTKEIIYLYPSIMVIYGATLFLSSIGLESKKIIAFYSTIVAYSVLVLVRTVNGIRYFNLNGFDTMPFVGLTVGNILMLWVCLYIYKEKNKEIHRKEKSI